MKTTHSALYTTVPVPKAVISLAVPTVISQLIHLAYNMADTFFVGQLNDPVQVAAATVSMPAFVCMVCISNLFGIGGASFVSRCLGRGDRETAKKGAAFSIWTACALALLYSLALTLFRPVILPILGTNADTYDLCYQYLFWTVSVGAVPAVLSSCLAHLVRAEGYSRAAGLGLALGGIMNILLDPIFIFTFGLEIEGAAIATMLSNCISAVYFLVLLFRIRHNTAITPHPRYYTPAGGIAKEIVMVGFPSCLMTLMGTLSNTALNNLIASYSNEAIAGFGIAKKVDYLAFAIGNGMTQGVLSLIAFNYAAKNYRRMLSAIKVTFLYTLCLSVAGTLLLFFGAGPVCRFFIDDPATVAYGTRFLKIICLTCPTISVTMMVITTFQAMGKKVQPMILSLLRKGTTDVPLMFLLNHLVGVVGVACATPITDVLIMLLAVLLFLPQLKKLRAELRLQPDAVSNETPAE